MRLETLVEEWQPRIQDPHFAVVADWKERTGGKVAGYFPVYTPLEIIHACGMLPVGLMGAGNTLEITNADARFGSFICSITKSTLELGLRGNLGMFDAMIFQSICDTARNLAFLFKRNFQSDLFVEYIHFPQNTDSEAAVDFLVSELERVVADLEPIAYKKINAENLRNSIRLFNQNRNWIRELYSYRMQSPHKISSFEVAVLLRAGNFLPPDEHSLLLIQALAALEERDSRPRDKIRVLMEGAFCEQPPLELLQALDEAGCYVVEDDLVLGRRWFEKDIPLTGEPLRTLAESYVRHSRYSSVRHDSNRDRTEAFLQKIKQSRANAVIFCIAKFCEPAFFDYVMFKDALEREGIPHLLVEFEEKMWTFERARTEVETFVESILFD
jgi:benzoyl-CoA reductase subunit C